MKKLTSFFVIAAITFFSFGCSEDSTSAGTDISQQELSKREFVWNAMNLWYYWRSDVPELADEHAYFDGEEDFHNYLTNFSDAQALYNDLQYDQEDEFSFFIDNYETFAQNQQGISKSFGYEFGLVCETQSCENDDPIFGYVQYVVPGSPAKKAGLERGDIFTKANGTQLTVNNYQNLLLDNDSYELSLAQIQKNSISKTEETVDLQAVQLQEDPVFTHEVIDTAGVKVGYLMYNAFHTNTHTELNDIFGSFKNIDDLVLDLRYNGGGALITSATLAGMISGLDSTHVFAKYTYNNKLSQLNTTYKIQDQVVTFENGNQTATIAMNQISIDHLYVLTGRYTASASEALINGLDAYMDVTLIGEQTVGKDEGSLTLYDIDYPYATNKSTDEINANSNIALQPIVLKITNKNGRKYPDGFQPDHPINEVNYLSDGLPALGNPDEPLFAKALALITGNSSMAKAKPTHAVQGHVFKTSDELNPYKGGMYLLPQQLSDEKLKLK